MTTAEQTEPTGAIPDRTPADWQAAAKELAGGNWAPIRRLLAEQDLPLRLVDLFAAAMADAAWCEAAIAKYRDGELEALEAERAALVMFRPTKLAEAQATAARLVELQRLASDATHRKGQAGLAEMYLGAMRSFLPELFGLEPPANRPGTMLFSPAVHKKIAELDLDPYLDSWRDCLREAEIKKERRKVRTCGIR